MTSVIAHQEFVETTQFSPEEITKQDREIHESVLAASPYLDGPNFTQFHPDDLRRLFDEYDRRCFQGRCRAMLGETPLRFRISARMTKAGGKTTWFVRQASPQDGYFEITVSSTLLFQTFHDVDRPITVAGVECGDRLQALQRIVEHELIHLIELLLWKESSCAAGRFQSIAARFFGHTDHRHQLVTRLEQAVKFRIGPGSRVRFRIDDAEHVGFVNRITKRATVLVEDGDGRRYSNGKRYAKFYVPLAMLEPVE